MDGKAWKEVKILIGQIIGNRYEIVDKLGGGGMAIVYKGTDRLLSRAVTIKVLREQLASDPEVVRRFQKEAQAVAKLSHPNIVSIYDVGQEKDIYYLVMEYIEGRTLKEIIQEKKRLESVEAFDYALQILDALQHAHDSNVIHRDIKPQNILVTNRGQAKVTDFGIAQAATNATMTYSGSSIIGTVQYISPEQAKGEIATVHTDIYSAGIVLYEMLTGRLPFEGDTAIGIAIKHIQADYPSASSLVPHLPVELEQAINKALAKKPQERYASAEEMKKHLEQIREKSASQLADTQLIPRVILPKTRKKPKIITWLLLVMAIAMIPVLAYFGLQRYLSVSEVVVPEVINISLAEAERLLLAKGLQWQEDKPRNDHEVPKGYVISQKPNPGDKLKKTRPVILTVSLGPALSKVPDVIGYTEREARVDIANAGFKVAPEVLRQHTDQMAEGYIFQQEPKPHHEAPFGSEVKLTISLGSQPRYIDMPNLIGKTLQEARDILEQNRLDSGEVTNEVSYEYFSGQVVNQDILPGDQVLQKTIINLALSLGPGPTPKMAAVQIRVEDDEKQHRIKIVVFDQTGEHEEYNNIHEANDFISIEVPYFGRGRVEVYEDDILINETPLN